MTKQEWLEKVNENKDVLRQLVANWHPSARRPVAIQREAVVLTDGSAVAVDVAEAHMPITAPAAEQACQQVRTMLRRDEPGDPLERWDKAVGDGDVGELNTLLSGAWFGVPESTSCWSIAGFAEAVDLMDDLPEEMYGSGPEEPEEEKRAGLEMDEILTMNIDDLEDISN